MHTEVIGGDRDQSLAAMGERMLKENRLFCGGVASTGGASLCVFERMGSNPSDLADDFDYVALFHRHLGIPISDPRFSQKPLP